MSTWSTADALPASRPEPSVRDAIGFALTIFTSAFLLFQVEPLISKAILPWFGGSPAVWTTCLLFFQTLLFAGYAYAHCSTRFLSPRAQALLQLGLIAVALVLMPIAPEARLRPSGDADRTLGVLLLLARSVGPAYFVLSSTGPLVQAWFSQAYPGRPPYRLYALSNIGSLLALVSYPFVFEPALTTGAIARLWSWLFAGYAALLALLAWPRLKAQPAEAAHVLAAPLPVEAPSWRQRALWVGLPAFASVALLATTNHVCEDVAVIPFLWVVPLALYLLSFIVAFDGPRWYSRRNFALAGVVLALAVGCVDPLDELCGLLGFELGFRSQLLLDFGLLFVVCMLCHGELVRARPGSARLTEFYLWIAFGGALGGLLVSIVCPNVFATFVEWSLSPPLSLALSVAVLVAQSERKAWRERRARVVAGLFVALGAAAILYSESDEDSAARAGAEFRRNDWGLRIRRAGPVCASSCADSRRGGARSPTARAGAARSAARVLW
ncbi:MAG: hypothetical protein QM756_38495 [Polyangiaceae bacterium]